MAKADCREGDTTPGTRKLSPTNRNVCGTTNGSKASSLRMIRNRGQMYSFVTMPKARKLIRTLSPNNAAIVMDRLLVAASAVFRASRSTAGKRDDQLEQFPRTIERQEVSAIFDRRHLRARQQAAVV